MASARFARERQDPGDYWPGFVDALATLLLVAIFLLSLFAVAQFALGQALSGRDQALAAARAQLAQLAEQLRLEQAQVADLSAQNSRLGASLATAEAEAETLRAEVSETQGQLSFVAASLADEQALSEAAQAEAALLRLEIAALNQQLAALAAALEASEARDREQEAQIENLSERLNAALARKAQELARVRSDFFAKLTNALGERSDVRIVGDRFVFETDVVFNSAEADITRAGEGQLSQIAAVILDIAEDIPNDVDWIIRVDGHTDIRSINTAEFPSNWHLSSERAISVVNFFEAAGIPSNRLVAAGFGEFHPIVNERSEAAFTRNRRIELKLDSR